MQMSSMAASDALPAQDAFSLSPISMGDRLLGLMVMAVLPALFWTALVAVAAPVLGYATSGLMLMKIGGGIGFFLACVCCAVTARRS
jgi:hypothetical protein